ncbi:RimK family alpha-L-glutamate ligase [Streptomyces cinereoruber]|uniref:RimK family alpha-L-glutamate ligase n=1 Tax=Streptomyces cinereoruber TaxID=67260 RepID=UPI003EC0FA9B
MSDLTGNGTGAGAGGGTGLGVGAGGGDGRPVALIASRVRFEEKLLLEAFRRRGAAVAVIDDRTLSYRIGDPAPPWRVVCNRSLAGTRRLEVSRMCEAFGVPVVNSSSTVAVCDSKIHSTLVLHAAGLPVPDTAVALTPAAGEEALRRIGLPAVVKPVNGSWGRGLCKVNDVDAVEGVLALKESLPSPQQQLVYAQEFVRTPQRDIRVVVAGDRAVTAVHRTGDHWIGNVARGARTSRCPLTPELEDLALRAAKAVGGGLLGVDLLESDDGRLLVNEVNSGVEFRGAAVGDEATALAIAEAFADHVLDQADHGVHADHTAHAACANRAAHADRTDHTTCANRTTHAAHAPDRVPSEAPGAGPVPSQESDHP